jgi:hypothetical protein
MRFLTLTSTLFTLCLSTIAVAGTEVGNGGDVVTCTNPKNAAEKTAELLDYYEARTMYGLPSTLKSNASVEENLGVLISTIAKTEPERAAKYAAWAITFSQEAAFMEDVELTDIDDSKHLAFPLGCKVEQIIIQKEVNYSFDKRYIVSKKLWDLLDNTNRAGLIFHELLYRDGIENKGLNNGSRVLRLLNGLVAANRFNEISAVEHSKIWSEFRFADIHLYGLFMKYNTFDKDDVYLSSFRSVSEQPFSQPRGTIKLFVDSEVQLYPNGFVKFVSCNNFKDGRQLPCSMVWDGKEIQYYKVYFYETGAIKFAEADSITVPIKNHGDLTCQQAKLYADGNLQSCYSKISQVRLESDRYNLTVAAKTGQSDGVFEFDTEGYLTRFSGRDDFIINGKLTIQNKLVTLENIRKRRYAVADSIIISPESSDFVAELKENAVFKVGDQEITFQPGDLSVYNDLIIRGVLAHTTTIPIRLNDKTAELKVTSQTSCRIFSHSKPLPTDFKADGTLKQGIAAESIKLSLPTVYWYYLPFGRSMKDERSEIALNPGDLVEINSDYATVRDFENEFGKNYCD